MHTQNNIDPLNVCSLPENVVLHWAFKRLYTKD